MTLLDRVQHLALPVVLGAALVTLSAPPAAAAEYDLKFGAVTTAGTSAFSEILAPFVRAVEAGSGGRIAIDLRPQGGFGPPVTLLKQVESGEIDIANALSGYSPGRFPRSSVMELPTMFDTSEAGSRIAWTLLEEGLIAADFKDLKVLGLFTGASYGLMTVDKDVKSLRDMRGMRIRVSGANVGLSLSRLGMIPLGLPANFLARSLTEKWVDGLAIAFEIAASTPSTPPRMVIDEVSTLIDARLSSSLQIIVMNKKRFDSLPPDLQAVIDRHSGRAIGLAAGAMSDRGDAQVKSRFASNPNYRFFALSETDRAELAQRVAPVLDDWAAEVGAAGVDGHKLIERVRSLARPPNS